MVKIKDLGAVRTRNVEPKPIVHPLSEEERAFLGRDLEASGVNRASHDVTEYSIPPELDVRFTDLKTAYTAVEAAQLLNTTPAVLKHSAEEGELYAFFADGELYLPKWQFLNGELLFTLKDLISVIPEEWAPYRVRIFMEQSETLEIPSSSFKLTGDYAALDIAEVRATVQLTPVEIMSTIGRIDLVQEIIDGILQYEMYR